MMWLYSVLSLILVSEFTIVLGRGLDAPNFEFQLAELLQARCIRHSDESAYFTLQQTLDNVKNCMNQGLTLPTLESQMYEFMCEKMPHQVYGCLDNLLDKLVPCLDVDEQYLSDFVLGSYNTSIEQQCQDGGQSIFQVIGAVQAFKCTVGFSKVGSVVVSQCLGNVMAILDGTKNFILKQDTLCSEIAKVEECAVKTVAELCQDNGLSGIINLIFSPFTKWCKSH